MNCYLDQLFPEQGESPEANVDIVFVHGLNPLGSSEHARKTWTHQNGNFWPQVLLPHVLPSSRVLLFGYNSGVFSFKDSGSTLRNHSVQLLDRLLSKRKKAEVSSRPIIFICHSLGGLVVKQALILAQLDPIHYGYIRSSTKGLVFFATPHRGGSGASIAEPVANIFSLVTGQPRNNLLNVLRKDSLFAKELTENFNPQKDDYEVRTFFETEPTAIKFNRWRMIPQVMSMHVVSQDSATYGSSREGYPIPIDDDHSGICKFSGLEDPKFDTVRRNIEEVANAILLSRRPSLHQNMRSTPFSLEARLAIEPRYNIGDLQIQNRQAKDTPGGHKDKQSFQDPDLAASPRVKNLTPKIQTSHFIGRNALLLELDRYFDHTKAPGRRAGLWGMGGVGKTQCALEFCRRRHEELEYSAFWFNAQSTETLQGSFRTTAEQLRLDTNDAVLSVKKWFRNPPKSLIVFDNVVSLEMISSFIPSGAVDILITTRDSALVGSEMIPFGIAVPLLDHNDAMALFVLNLGSWDPKETQTIRQDVDQIFLPSGTTAGILAEKYHLKSTDELKKAVDLIDRLSLAIVQCASYLREYPMPFSLYLEKFRAKVPETRRKFYAHLMKGATYHQSVMTTWDISIDMLSINAVKMATLFGFLGHNQISIIFLEDALKDSRFWGGECSIQLSREMREFFAFLSPDGDFYESLGALVSLNLITKDAGGRQIFIHPMIHEYIHLRLPTKEATEWLINVVILLSHRLPPLMYSAGRDTDAPREAELVFSHLDRAADLTELYYESIILIRPPLSVLFFLEAYLWYRGVRYLHLAENLACKMLKGMNTSGHPWDFEMVYGAKLLSIVLDFQADPGNGLDVLTFDNVVEQIQSLPRPKTSRPGGSKETLLQATMSYRWVDALFSEGAMADELRAAHCKFPLFSWQVENTPSRGTIVDRVSSAIFAHCQAKTISMATVNTDNNLGAPAAELLLSYRNDALLGIEYGCSELEGYFSDLLSYRISAVRNSNSVEQAMKLVELLSFYHLSDMHRHLDRQWHAIESALKSYSEQREVMSAASPLVQYEYFSDRFLNSPIFRRLVFDGLAQEENWLKRKISVLGKQPANEKRQNWLRRYKFHLAEVLTGMGNGRVEEAHNLLLEVFDRRFDLSQLPGKGLSRYAEKILEPLPDIPTFRSRTPFYCEVVMVLTSLGSPEADNLVALWILDSYKLLERESPETVFFDLCHVILPSWNGYTGKASCKDEFALDLLDRWGLFIVNLPGPLDRWPITFLRAYKLCQGTFRHIHSRLRYTRMQLWAAKLDDYEGLFGRFGSWLQRPVTERNIMDLTLAGIRLQRLSSYDEEVKRELLQRLFDEKEIERSFRHPLLPVTSLRIAHEPTFVSLPLGRVIGTATEVAAACYHGPRCGLWVVREPQSSRSLLLWTRAEKPGLFYIDVSSTTSLVRYYNSWVFLYFGEPEPSTGRRDPHKYCFFQLHYTPYGDWRFKENGIQLLEQFSAAGGTTKEVEMDWELYGWKPRDMTDCDQYSAFKRFMEVNKDPSASAFLEAS